MTGFFPFVSLPCRETMKCSSQNETPEDILDDDLDRIEETIEIVTC